MLTKFDGIKIRALQGVLPPVSVDAKDQLIAENVDVTELAQLQKSLGFRHCRFLPQSCSFTDMMGAALKEFISHLKIEPESIDYLISVTQTPRYLAPGNSFIYHRTLNLSLACGCIDILGTCSGIMIALHQAAALIKAGVCQRILIVGGDHLLHIHIDDHLDKTTHLLSDAGCILLLEADKPNAASATLTHTSADKLALASQPTPVQGPELDFSLYFNFETFSEYYDFFLNKSYSSTPEQISQNSQLYPRTNAIQLHAQDSLMSSGSDTNSTTVKAIISNEAAPSAQSPANLNSISLIQLTRKIQAQTVESLRQLLQSTHLRLSDLGCGVLQQKSLIFTQTSNLYLNRVIDFHLTSNVDPNFACFDVSKPDFFPFVLEDVGHVFSASIPLALSLAPERFPDCQSKPIFLSSFGAGMSFYSALVDLRQTTILPPFYYQAE